MTAQAVFDPLESEPQTAAQADAAEEMELGGQAGKNYGEAQLVSVSKDSGTEFFEQARLNRSKARDEALDAIKKTLKSADLSESEKEKREPASGGGAAPRKITTEACLLL